MSSDFETKLEELERIKIFSRFMTKINFTKTCWLWTGPINNGPRNGYAFFDIKIAKNKWKQIRAHRYIWKFLMGNIPNNLVIDHICRIRHCVNPTHLRLVTHRTNSLENSNSVAARNSKKTHCPKGHPLNGDNLRPPMRWRRCKKCSNINAQTYRARKALSESEKLLGDL